MESNLEKLIRRLQSAEPEHSRRLSSASRKPITNWSIRRGFLSHRSASHSLDRARVLGGTPVDERAWLGWTTLRWIIEIALTRMRDPTDRKLLQNHNESKFGSPSVPSIRWLMDQVKVVGGSETAQYEGILRWVLKPHLYSYQWRELGGEEFKRLKRDQKGDPRLAKVKVSYSSTDDPEYPLVVNKGGKIWKIRVNEFPDLPLYTLLINDEEVMDFDNWPKNWVRPKMSS